MRALRVMLILVVALLIACPVMAQEKEKKKGRRGGPGVDRVKALLESLNLTDEQKTKVADVNKEFEPKLAEARKKLDGVLTDEQKKARDEAVKAAKDAGKSPREVFTAGRQAVNLTDEQKTKMADGMKEIGAVEKDRMEKIKAILTPEQKEQLEKKIEEYKKGGKKKRD